MDDLYEAVGAATHAPSVHNTQPWRFAVQDEGVTLRADAARRLDTVDPRGREMLIGCGAALGTLRLAVRAAGREERTRLLPDPDRPHLLAEVERGAARPPEPSDLRLFAQVRTRRTHRGGFLAEDVPAALIAELVRDADLEGARLVPVSDAADRAALAALTQVAEHVLGRVPALARELARWAPAPGSSRADGVHPGAYPAAPARTEPHFPARDFARGRAWGAADDPGDGTGAVLLLTTTGDDPADWLRAGQALQRVLLRAADAGLAAAFHTQALELDDLRAFLERHFTGGAHAQMLLRVGRTGTAPPPPVRRPLADVLD
ncbi:Acg family FMN-binding oxidoreductase [Actinomadura flavalba]|uniref:Acg family FMN-binding oxidoreductase n=1 Tax=Actinomadura flavalba TaxID=1120938 RepID=UPI0003A609E3|nr:nitroreductase family protein [Actinomadura flavalba]